MGIIKMHGSQLEICIFKDNISYRKMNIKQFIFKKADMQN